MAGEHSQSRVATRLPPGDMSGGDVVQHRVRPAVGLVSLSWNPGEGAFVAERGQERWSSPRLGDLARTVGISIPAKVARELRRAEQLNPAPRFHTPSADSTPSSEAPIAAIEPTAPSGHAEAPAWSPAAGDASPSGGWVHEAPARHELIENLGSIIQDLARGELLHQAVGRLEGLADRFGPRVEPEGTPVLDAVTCAQQRTMPRAPAPTATAVDRLHALRSQPAPSAEAIAGP